MTTTTASRSQSDAEIIEALRLEVHPLWTITLDRSDPYRIVVLGNHNDGQGEWYMGRAILAPVDGSTQRRWHLGCLDCDTGIQVSDAAVCPGCRERRARDGNQFILCPPPSQRPPEE